MPIKIKKKCRLSTDGITALSFETNEVVENPSDRLLEELGENNYTVVKPVVKKKRAASKKVLLDK